MSVNPKERAALQEMWGSAKSTSSEVPDGTYQFTITKAWFHMSNNGKPQFKLRLKVKGGADEYVGKELEDNNNLETPMNMGFFKRKLTRLNVTVPEDFEEITDGTLAEHLKGKVFEGQVKTKNDFLNVYVNRLLGEAHVEDEDAREEERQTGRGEPEDVESEEPEGSEGFAEGDKVTWPGHTGTVVEALDDGKYRVKDDEDRKVYRVDGSKIRAHEEEESNGSENGNGEVALPTAEEAESLPAAEVKQLLKDLGIKAEAVKHPRTVLQGIAALAEDPKARLELTQVSPLMEALKIPYKKGAKIAELTKIIAEKVQELVG